MKISLITLKSFLILSFLSLLFLALNGCSTLQKPENILDFQYELGVTTKYDILESIGLPNHSKISEDGLQLITYYYEGIEAKGLGIAIPLYVLLIVPEFTTQAPLEDRKSILKLVFDADGILVEVDKNEN